MSDLDFEAAIAAKFAEVPEGTTPEAEVTATPEVAVAVAEPESPETEGEVAEAAPARAEPARRDEKGRFTQERPEWLPPQFKTVEDYNKSFNEAQSLIGRLGQEVGELRQSVEKREEAPVPHGQLQEAIMENPEGVAMWALRNQREDVLEQALGAWHQQALDDQDGAALVSAQRFQQEIAHARLKHEFSQEVLPSIEGVKREAGARALAIAQRELAQQYPDFDQVLESASSDSTLTERLNTDVLRQLQESDPKAALEYIYATASARQRISQVAETDQKREESLERKRQAAVATSSSSPAERSKDPKEALKEFFATPELQSVRHGLVRE